MSVIYTIGHSTHPSAVFVGLLRRHQIAVVADVRSQPYSRMHPQFSRDSLEHTLTRNGLEYLFLGQELGGRSGDPDCYMDGRVRYERVAKTRTFECGLDRLEQVAGKHRVALMCSEKDPLTCHRGILIGRILRDRGLTVHHIMEAGDIEDHDAAEERLVRLLRMPEPGLFTTMRDIVDEAYALQSEKIAYQIKPAAAAAGSALAFGG